MTSPSLTARRALPSDLGEAARKRRTRLRAVAGLAPVLLWQVVFFVIPMALMTTYSFWRMIDFKLVKSFTLYNYLEAFRNPLLWKAFVLSLEIAVAVTLVCAVLAYPIAYFIAKKAGRWKIACLIAVIIPFWTSFVLRAYAWKLLLGARGFINEALELGGLINEPLIFLLYSPIATSIGLIYAFLPFYILPLYTSIDKVQDSWLEAAASLRASPFRCFIEVTFPLCLPGLVVGGVFTFIFSLGEYVIPQLLGGGTKLLAAQAVVLEFETMQNWPGGAALSILLLLIVVTMLALLFRWVRMEDVF